MVLQPRGQGFTGKYLFINFAWDRRVKFHEGKRGTIENIIFAFSYDPTSKEKKKTLVP